MHQIYTYTIEDYMGGVDKLEFTGPIQPDNASAISVMDLVYNALLPILGSIITKKSYGVEEVVTMTFPPIGSTNIIRMKAGYTQSSGAEGSIEVPGIDPSGIDFLQGDLIKLNRQPIKNLLDVLEDETVHPVTLNSISFDYAVLIGEEN